MASDDLMDPMGQGMQFELLAAALRSEETDTAAFLEALATKLGGALPHRTQIERGGGLFSHGHPVRRIVVQLGEWEYTLIAGAAHELQAARAHAVRGITLKNEPLSVDQWIESLAADLADLAQTSEHEGAALHRLLG